MPLVGAERCDAELLPAAGSGEPCADLTDGQGKCGGSDAWLWIIIFCDSGRSAEARTHHTTATDAIAAIPATIAAVIASLLAFMSKGIAQLDGSGLTFRVNNNLHTNHRPRNAPELSIKRAFQTGPVDHAAAGPHLGRMNTATSRLVLAKFDESRVRAAAEELRAELGAAPTLALAFVSTSYMDHLAEFQEIVAVHGHAATLCGCTGSGLIGTAREAEMTEGFSLLLLHLPEANIRAVPLAQSQVETADGDAFWREATGGTADAWLTLANPFRFDADTWLREWSTAFPGAPVLGGLAGGPRGDEDVTVFGPTIGDTSDAMALALDGVRLETVVSQGCRPIGEALPVTRADEHLLIELGSRPAYQVLEQAFNTLADADKRRARGNLFAGLAIDEYKEQFTRGDFLVRNILGADPATGAVVVGAHPRTGQTLQYQLRDAASADEELKSLLAPLAARQEKPTASLLFCCNGRGKHLFGTPDHDAQAVVNALGSAPSAGFFCNGEIGPVGGSNFLHGYTASIGLIY
jgi:small ligand-binding sensory domain FIST